MSYIPKADQGESRPVVLFVSPVADLKGGGERVLLHMFDNPAIRPALAVPAEGDLARIARERGFPVHLFDLGAIATVHRPPRPSDLLNAGLATRRCARRLAAIAQETGAALLHTNGLKAHVIGALARRAHRLPVVAHLHDIPHTRLERLIWRAVALGVSRMVVVSQPCFPGRRLPDTVAVVPNGVQATAGIAVGPRRLPEFPTIGFVGRFHPFKGLHLLLDWFEHASATRPELKLLIRGRADQEGEAYWAGLQDQVARLTARGTCQVVGWTAPGRDPYEGMDILVVPSETPDPSPLVILEAMLRGIPPIGYPAGGIPALIGGDEHGALAATAPEFAAALDRLLEPGAYRRASAAASARVQTVFTRERFWATLNAQYALLGVRTPDMAQA